MEANPSHLIFHPFIHFLSRLILRSGRGSSDFDLNHFLELKGKSKPTLDQIKQTTSGVHATLTLTPEVWLQLPLLRFSDVYRQS